MSFNYNNPIISAHVDIYESEEKYKSEIVKFQSYELLNNYYNFVNISCLNINNLNLELINYLPPKLEELNISYNSLRELPPNLPKSLKFLFCNNNYLSNIDNLPDSLKFLDCSKNYIVNLKIPKNLNRLICSYNLLNKFSEFPDNLHTVICFNNQIEYLPDLNNIAYMDCKNNKLEKLPIKSNFTNKIIYFNVCNNNMKNIPSYYYLYMNKTFYIKLSDNPIENTIKNEFYNNTNMYLLFKLDNDRNQIKKIENWFLECKYNPKYKYCRDWLLETYNNLYVN
jgi:hypothetical protein